MTVQEGSGGKGTRFISKKYPPTSGITAGTTKTEGRKINVEATKSSLVKSIKKVGLRY